ncbi:MAG TPA: hypothetical protein VMV01_15325 [Planctomycetota bacterium]|nr:hypothetical protein [Planctomycetota bacterium]
MTPALRLRLAGAAAIAAGVVSIAFGLLHVLAVVVLPEIDRASAFAGLVLYVLAGLLLVGAGIGSLRRRRWVRPVMLLASGTWILVGLGAVWLVLQLGPELALAAGVESEDPLALVVQAVTLGAVTAFGILLPGALFWIYRDPRLVDAFVSPEGASNGPPAEVLTLSVALGVSSLACVPLLARPVVPLFGRLVAGRAGLACVLGAAVGCLWLAWSTYRQRLAGYRGTLAALVLLGVSTVWTFLRVDAREILRTVGYPEDLLAQLPSLPAAARNATLVATVAMTVGGVVWLVRLRRHFT